MTSNITNCQHLINSLTQQVHSDDNTVMVGLHTAGIWVAESINAQLATPMPLGSLDITFYRDDYSQKGLNPEVRASNIPFDIENKRVILIDDVLYTGRTIRAALSELFDFGRPDCVELAVLFDRGGRELPIQANYVGEKIELTPTQYVKITGPEPLCYEIKS